MKEVNKTFTIYFFAAVFGVIASFIVAPMVDEFYGVFPSGYFDAYDDTLEEIEARETYRNATLEEIEEARERIRSSEEYDRQRKLREAIEILEG